MRTRAANIFRPAVLLILLAGVVGLQFAYDRAVPASADTKGSAIQGGLPPLAIRAIDMGFHSTIASFMWAATMPEVLDLYFFGDQRYLSDRSYLNEIDPKLSYPYAFSVLLLPAIKNLPNGLAIAQAIGKDGIAHADPDWRIPYYMAINYYLESHDLENALRYFNIAANTPGIPDYAARFSLNFGIDTRERDRVRGIWETIYESTNDPTMKARAAAYVERLNDFDYLQAAAKEYKARYGAYPTSTAALVEKGIIPAVPQDPFGFTFIIKPDGSAAIDLSKAALPFYIKQGTTAKVLP